MVHPATAYAARTGHPFDANLDSVPTTPFSARNAEIASDEQRPLPAGAKRGVRAGDSIILEDGAGIPSQAEKWS